MSNSKPFTSSDKSRIQGSQAKQNGGKTESGSFPARVQHLVDRKSK
ncbi:hypothetical protein [Tolumonas lignilytica]|nr:hypothetical protein [Tolumonas lignilytica]